MFNIARTGFTFAEDSIKTSGKVQKFILALDAVATCFNGWQVYNAYKKKNRIEHILQPKMFYGKVAVSGLALLGVAACVIKGTNHAFAPKIDLSALIPSEAAGHLTACWKRPLLNDLVRGLFFVRIVLNLGLAKLGAEPSQSILNSILMGASLAKMSWTPWIQITRTSLKPFETMNFNVTEGGSLEDFKNAVSELKSTFYLKTTSQDTSDLTSKIKSVYEYSSNIFHNSSWSRFWEVTANQVTNKEDYSSKLKEKATGENVREAISFIITSIFKKLLGNRNHLRASSVLIYEARLASDNITIKLPFVEFVKAKLFHSDKIWKSGFFSGGKFNDYSKWIAVRLFGR